MIAAVIGGTLIGLAAAILWLGYGRVMGASGILGALFETGNEDHHWRWLFLVGVVLGGGIWMAIHGTPAALEMAPWQLILAGALVGVGTTIGSGCTSGHGICGLSRFSVRSIAATLTFMATAILTVWLVNPL